MLTYQVRPRVLRFDSTTPVMYPADGRVCFHLSPPQPFGVLAGGGHTAVQSVPASAIFNANTGQHSIESKEPLRPLEVVVVEPDRKVQLNGCTLAVTQQFGSAQEVSELIESVYFALPSLLSTEFADPVVIDRVDGCIGQTTFRWELRDWRGRFQITTQEKQESIVASSWIRLGLLSGGGKRRLFAAIHYFHVAVRLARQATIAGEFLPEMILNFAKVLEVLFPPCGNGKTRDAARRGLMELDFSETEIEADYIPTLALRNEIDVGHVDLSLFTLEQLTLIHAYVSHAEGAFRTLLQRALARSEAASFAVPPYEPSSAPSSSAKVVDRLRSFASRYAP